MSFFHSPSQCLKVDRRTPESFYNDPPCRVDSSFQECDNNAKKAIGWPVVSTVDRLHFVMRQFQLETDSEGLVLCRQ